MYLPFAFTRNIQTDEAVLFHDGATALSARRRFHPSPDCAEVTRRGAAPRRPLTTSWRTYVALTRAQSQVVAWWAPSWDEPNGGLSRLLRGRRPGDNHRAAPLPRPPAVIDDADAMAALRAWSDIGGPALEESVVLRSVRRSKLPPPPIGSRGQALPSPASTRRGGARRTRACSRSAENTPSASPSEPEVVELDDEAADIPVHDPVPAGPPLPAVASPMADLPMGAKFGTLVHAVLETADPFAADLAAELEQQIREHSVWWPVDAEPSVIWPLRCCPCTTPRWARSPPGATLRQIGLPDRLRELDFEFPLAGGDIRAGLGDFAALSVRRANVGAPKSHDHAGRRRCAVPPRTSPADDALASYAARLSPSGTLAAQPLKGYLTGSVDAVLRIPDGQGHRYLVVDYKTNWLGEPPIGRSRPPTTPRARMVEAMLHSDYPLQALLYSRCVASIPALASARLRPTANISVVCCTCSCAECAAPDTPIEDEHPAGVFSWQPPASLILHGVRPARRGAGGGMTTWSGDRRAVRRDCCARSPTPRCSSRRMCMWRSG